MLVSRDTTVSLLVPVGVNQKSFYGKALVIRDNDTGDLLLQSYDSIVIETEGSHFKVVASESELSLTTLRHIKSFMLSYLGYDDYTLDNLMEYHKVRSFKSLIKNLKGYWIQFK